MSRSPAHQAKATVKANAANNVIIVYNLVGTSRRKCQCSYGQLGWIHHWTRMTGQPRPEKCCVKRCRNPAQVGAHVRVEGSDGRRPWILPTCQKHNKRPSSQPMEVKHDYIPCGATMSDCL